MSPDMETFRTAVRHHQAGKLDLAAELYQRSLDQDSRHSGAWHLLGVVRHQQGESSVAVSYIAKAIAIDDSKATYHNNLGVAQRALGSLDEALKSHRRALALKPEYADAHANSALVLHELGKHEEAEAAFEAVLRLQPEHVDALFNFGNLLRDLGRTGEAIAFYEKAVRIQPGRADCWNNLGNALLAERRAQEAIEGYQTAIGQASDFAEAHLNLGVAYAQREMVEDARRCYATACRLKPDRSLWQTRELGLCPAVFQTVEEICRYRADLEAALDRLRETLGAVDWRTLPADGAHPSFYLSHHGKNNRVIKEKFAALYSPSFAKGRPAPRPGKPRIGFLVTRHHEEGFLRGMSGIIEHLDRSRFEPVVLCSASILLRCKQALRRTDVEFIGFPDHFAKAVEIIMAAGCSIVYHWQIGTDPLNYFLPFADLAAVQCTGWGTHGTTGIANVDYYLSSRLIETENADEHYTEGLWQFETMPSYQPRIPQPEPAARARFGLPETGSLYLCPQRLAKFHPDFDPILRRILESDPTGFVIALEGNESHVAAQLKERFTKSIGKAHCRILFLPSRKPSEYYQLLSLADAVLDPPHYSSALTGYDALGLTIPVVTLPGQYNVERYALGLHRKMGLESLVAASPTDYVDCSVRLGTDPEYRRSIQSLIAERMDALFEDMDSVRRHEQFLEYALQKANPVQ